MDFEFDEEKSKSNQTKHGIDFVSAQTLWNDTDLVVIPAKTKDEIRLLVVGKIANKHWSCVITTRGQKICIISVRRSRRQEVASMRAKEFDKKFDSGEDMTQYLDVKKAFRPQNKPKRLADASS